MTTEQSGEHGPKDPIATASNAGEVLTAYLHARTSGRIDLHTLQLSVAERMLALGEAEKGHDFILLSEQTLKTRHDVTFADAMDAIATKMGRILEDHQTNLSRAVSEFGDRVGNLQAVVNNFGNQEYQVRADVENLGRHVEKFHSDVSAYDRSINHFGEIVALFDRASQRTNRGY